MALARRFGRARRQHPRSDVDADQALRLEPVGKHFERTPPAATNVDDDWACRGTVVDQSREIVESLGKNVPLPRLGAEKPNAEARLRYVWGDFRPRNAGQHAGLYSPEV